MTTEKRNEYARRIADDICMSRDVETDLDVLIETAYACAEIKEYQYITFYNSMSDVRQLLHVARRILYSIVDGIIEPDEEEE